MPHDSQVTAMIAIDSACLTTEQLRNLAVGRLPGERFQRLLDHLEACSKCQQRAMEMEPPEDSLAAAIATPPQPDPHAAEADCLAALHACCGQAIKPLESSLPPIQRLGQYELIRALGNGGMGAVYLARHTRLQRRCAIKLLPRDRGFDAAWRERFDREMAAVAGLNSPHVVSASDAGEASGWHYLVMEHLDGLDLGRLAARVQRLTVADACELTRQAAVGLAHVHAAELVHRDIKPSNLMLTRDGVVKILDLGLVLSGTDPLPADDRLTTVGQLMGTLAYMAPEQLIDSSAVDHRADLYALGATLFRLLAGETPHRSGGGIAQLVINKTAHPAPSVSDYRDDLPARLVELIGQLLHRDPQGRPAAADEVAERLQPFAAAAHPQRLIRAAMRQPPSPAEFSAGVTAVPRAPSAFAAPPHRGWRQWIAAAAGLPLLVLAGIAIVIMTDRGQLVIQSETDDVKVSVQRGDEVVEQLQLATGDNRVTLRSGSYTVTIDEAADGLRLSDNTATVLRGEETVLRVHRDEAGADPAASATGEVVTAGPRFRGQPLNHWLAVLEAERDVQTVIAAMHAVVELTKDASAGEAASLEQPNLRLRAAEAILQAARRYGGTVASGPDVVSGQLKSPSEQFMAHLVGLYPALMPNPGLQAISHELAVGTSQSSMAALWILHDYAAEHVQSEHHRPGFGELRRWSETVEGRARLVQLARHIDQAVERLGGYHLRATQETLDQSLLQFQKAGAVQMAYETRLRITELLGKSALEDPSIADRLKNSIAQVAANYQNLFEKPERRDAVAPSGSVALTEAEIRSALGSDDSASLAWAAAPSLLLVYYVDSTFPQQTLHRLAAEAATPTADALLALLEQRGISDGMRVTMSVANFDRVTPVFMDSRNLPLVIQAVTLIAEHTSHPQRALAVLNTMLTALESAGSFGGRDGEMAPQYRELDQALQAAIQTLQTRAE